jgi:pyruvate-formate lyase
MTRTIRRTYERKIATLFVNYRKKAMSLLEGRSFEEASPDVSRINFTNLSDAFIYLIGSEITDPGRVLIELMVNGCNIVDAIHAEIYPSPFLSLTIADCLERGLDVTAGGAHYNFSGVQGVQIANVADSLAAVRQAVFDESWLPAADMLAALRDNFAGREALRQRLINRVPKYGNDDDRVDQYAQRWGNRYSELVERYPTIRGGVYQPGFYTVSAHVPMGANVGATPAGRFAGTPLADGGLSPARHLVDRDCRVRGQCLALVHSGSLLAS